MDFKISNIIKNFAIEGEFEYFEDYGCGHINDTFAVYFKNAPNRRYILQRINTTVFKNPEQVMDNVSGVTNFIKDKIIETGGDPLRETLTLIPVKNTNNKSKEKIQSAKETYLYIDENKNYWRSYLFIEGITSYQVVEDPSHLYQTGKAFGIFQKYLSDYPADTLYETIKDFHNTKKRFDDFLNIVDADTCDRVKKARKEIDFIIAHSNDVNVLVDMLEKKQLPLRVTHNDTKFNNVLIDNITGNAICVVDLDTVMPGLSVYDYGDSIRSGTNPSDEDEIDLSKVYMDETLFKEYTRGYLEEAKHFLTENEIKMLPFSAKLIAIELGIRFLSDYLNGDIYFKIHRDNHNLDRARTQLKMAADMENKMEIMTQIINDCL